MSEGNMPFKKNNGSGNIYTKKAIIRQEIHIHHNSSPSDRNYVPDTKISQIDKMIDELVIMEKVINNTPKASTLKKYRGIIKKSYGDGAYNKLTPENFEKAKKYLLNELYQRKPDFLDCLKLQMQELKPEQLIGVYKAIEIIIK